MPDISATVKSILTNDETVSGYVSTRVFSDRIPQNAAMPAISCYVVDSVPNSHLTDIVGISRARVQIDCFANTRSTANAVADSVRLAMTHLDHETVGSQYVNAIELVSGPDESYDRAKSGEDNIRRVASMDFYVHYTTTTS